ncbi:MAG: NifB/NifX family molybdenum-iron cluster-binding protein [Anaerolineales bacterium]|nr:NifB/NifX family molybdenum-iron cluster-binding protein [Anaerolineales bacterium]
MRIAISADDNNGLESVVSPHFGRCPYYVLVDMDGRQVSQVNVVENQNYGRHAPGTVPLFIRDQGADVMLAGGMGRRAIVLFEELGIQAVTGAAGQVQHALEQYLGGTLRAAEPCLTSRKHDQQEIPIEGAYEQDDVGRLREETELLQAQLTEVMNRLEKLN